MSHRNLPETKQHSYGTHGDDCGCWRGDHIWDMQIENQLKSERFCVCCEHYFLSEDAEDKATDNAIDYPGKPTKSKQPGGFSKGVIKRR
jgi:hypothetical protein